MEDIQIIELYFARKESAISETDTKYGRYCLTVANNILHNSEDSEECKNDTYMKTWRVIPPKKPDNFRAFLGKIRPLWTILAYRNIILYDSPDNSPKSVTIQWLAKRHK